MNRKLVFTFAPAAVVLGLIGSSQALAGDQRAVSQRGKASWYGKFHHGHRTASGEIFNSNALTAAHRTLRFGSRVRVKHETTRREVTVRINDRGPFKSGRIIDLSRAAAKAIGLIGVASVTLGKV